MSERYKLDLSKSKISDYSQVMNTERVKKPCIYDQRSRPNLKIDDAYENISPFLQKKLNLLSRYVIC